MTSRPAPVQLQKALVNADAWQRLVAERSATLGRFLEWASACEAGGPETSLRLDHRDDIVRCRSVLPLFNESWWGVVVYSCFDSIAGTETAAKHVRAPLPAGSATEIANALEFPRGSVQHHRAQATLSGARRSLASACEKAESIRLVLCGPGYSFNERFTQLEDVNVSWWGRTTCFDALLRAGTLGVTAERYRPERAYLRGSQGPAAGFEDIWGLPVTNSTADECEQILLKWTDNWYEVAATLGVVWDGPPYDSGDFENALCIFQEPPNPRRPDPN